MRRMEFYFWHEKTRRYLEAVSFVLTRKPTERQSQEANCFNSIQGNLPISAWTCVVKCALEELTYSWPN